MSDYFILGFQHRGSAPSCTLRYADGTAIPCSIAVGSSTFDINGFSGGVVGDSMGTLWESLIAGGRMNTVLLHRILASTLENERDRGMLREVIAHLRENRSEMAQILDELSRLRITTDATLDGVRQLQSDMVELKGQLSETLHDVGSLRSGDGASSVDPDVSSGLDPFSAPSLHDVGLLTTDELAKLRRLARRDASTFDYLLQKNPEDQVAQRIRLRRVLQPVLPADPIHQDAFTVHADQMGQGLFVIPYTQAVIPPDMEQLVIDLGTPSETVIFERTRRHGLWRLWTPYVGGKVGTTHDTRIGSEFLGVLTCDAADGMVAYELSIGLLGWHQAGRVRHRGFVIFAKSSEIALRALAGQTYVAGGPGANLAYSPICATREWEDVRGDFVFSTTENQVDFKPVEVPTGRNLLDAALDAVGFFMGKIPADVSALGVPVQVPLPLASGLPPSSDLSRILGSNFGKVAESYLPTATTHDVAIALHETAHELLAYYELGSYCSTGSGRRVLFDGTMTLEERLAACGAPAPLIAWVVARKYAYSSIPTYCLRTVSRYRTVGKSHAFNGAANIFKTFDSTEWGVCINCGAIRSSVYGRQECEALDMQIMSLSRIQDESGAFRYCRSSIGMCLTRDYLVPSPRLRPFSLDENEPFYLSHAFDGSYASGPVFTRGVIRETRFGNHHRCFQKMV